MSRRRFMCKSRLIPPSGCVAWYLFLSDDLGKDYSGNNLNATSQSAVSYSQAPGDKHFQGGCVSFDSRSAFISVPHNSLLSFTGNFSFEFWIKAQSFTTYNTILAKGYSSSWVSPYCDYLAQATGSYFYCGLTSDATSSDKRVKYNMSTNIWYHVVFTCSSSRLTKLYINGVLIGTNSGTISRGSGPLIIGNAVSKSESLLGTMNNLRIYNRELSATEVLQHYNDEK